MNTNEVPQEMTKNMLLAHYHAVCENKGISTDHTAELLKADTGEAQNIWSKVLHAAPSPRGKFDPRGIDGNALARNFKRLAGEFKYAWKATEHERKDWLKHPWDLHKLTDWATEFTEVTPYWVAHANAYALLLALVAIPAIVIKVL